MSFITDIFDLSAPGAALTAKVVEVVAVIAIVTGGIATFAHYERGIELTKLKDSSTKLLAKANAKITQQTIDHNAFVKTNTEKLNAALSANTALVVDRDQRVRDFDAYRASHPDVPRSVGGSGAASEGECGAQSCGDLASGLAKAGNELADANGQLSAALQSCQRDRDSLTGLP